MELDTREALRQVLADPGLVVKRNHDADEPLVAWQARAVAQVLEGRRCDRCRWWRSRRYSHSLPIAECHQPENVIRAGGAGVELDTLADASCPRFEVAS